MESKLGEGGMGQVYLARTAGGRRVVVKVIRPELTDDPDFRARFAREAEMARKVGGFHTAQVVDADPEADPPWIATAFVPGPSLEQAVRKNGPLKEPELTALALGLAEGLEAIHGCGLVHRDLKPANILLAEDGPRIIDFGIARPMDATEMTGTGTVLGTLTYMSPEQAKSEPVGPASDMFTLGTVLAFAATGTNPFASQTMGAIVFKVISNAPEVKGLPDRFQPIIAACWDHDPKQRPTPGDVITTLDDVDTGAGSSGEADLPPERAADEPPASVLVPTRRESKLPGRDIQDSPRPESPSSTKPSLFWRRPLSSAVGTVLIAGLVYWAVPSSAEDPTPSEVEADLVVDLHEGLYEEDDDPHSSIRSMKLSPDGSTLATHDDFSLSRGWLRPNVYLAHIRLWDVETGEMKSERRINTEEASPTFLFDPYGTPLYAEFTHGENFFLKDAETGKILLTLDSREGIIRNLEFSDDGSSLLSKDSKEAVHEWNAETGEYVATHDLEDDVTLQGTLSPDQTIVVHQDGDRLDLFSTDSGELIGSIEGEEEGIRSHTFNPNGTILATGGDTDLTQLWDTDTRELIATHTTYEDTFYARNFGPRISIGSITFSPDGKTIAVGRSDGDIYLWDTKSGEHTLTLAGEEEDIRHVVFSPDGNTLFAGGSGSMLRMWKLT
ncbi:WD40 repeat domain-containing serine/threonine protein kinase [Nocardiopsis sp. JB363]|uniref:WD40 repeat domain-containing serine/threonine protein kinase n=1 Tax=Nocardiopsis sp. JB363 TaxID=1434837 RepID=UPI00118125CA|nr:serine/threonine-protein kinase [Nocardiopsis sp. JB363]